MPRGSGAVGGASATLLTSLLKQAPVTSYVPEQVKYSYSPPGQVIKGGFKAILGLEGH